MGRREHEKQTQPQKAGETVYSIRLKSSYYLGTGVDGSLLASHGSSITFTAIGMIS